MRGGRAAAGVLWLVLTVVGELTVGRGALLPRSYARQSEVVDEAFVVLIRLAIPVVAFVVAMVVVSLLLFGSRREPRGDGPPEQGSKGVYALWLGVTGALAILLIINPGITGLNALSRGEEPSARIVKMKAAQWAWTATYPEAGISSSEELVLPVDEPVEFEVESVDVLHSFWIPAFRIKIDAVPGQVTRAYATPTQEGSFARDSALRVQCAELCGLQHAAMQMPVRIVSAGEFSSWIREQKQKERAEMERGCKAEARLVITASDITFDKKCLAVPAGDPFTIELVNKDAVPHNLAIYTDESAQEVLFQGEVFTGPKTVTYRVEPLDPGRYFFQCDIHPIPAMQGIFLAKRGA